MKKLLLALLAVVTLTGCGSAMPLDKKWAPLVQVEEAPDKLVQPGVTTTIIDTCYVNNLNDWLVLYPNGSVAQEALLHHEREHARRQAAFPGGPGPWLALYLADRNFRWVEEQAGWRLEISYNVNHLYGVDVDGIALILNENYGPVGGRMVSFADAKAFVLDVIAHPTPDGP